MKKKVAKVSERKVPKLLMNEKLGHQIFSLEDALLLFDTV